ncbi:MAG: DUF1697 domain-containing protein [Patescibacteria group bacterium]
MKYVALLRGINVGGNKTVNMKMLTTVCESVGCTNVTTYINSGNVIFSDSGKNRKALAQKMEMAIEKKFGFAVRVLVRDAKNIQALAKAIPASWQNDTEQRTDVLFLWDAFDTKETIGLIKHNPKIDTLKYVSGAIVWNLNRKNYNKSGLHDLIGTEVYKNMTARNVNTVRRLAAMLKVE